MKKAITVLAICVFIVEQVGFALPPGESGSQADNLSPVSRFEPLVSVEGSSEEPNIRTVSGQSTGLDENAGTFREDAVFIYLSQLLGGMVSRFGGSIRRETVIDIVNRHLPETGNLSRFNISGITIENDTYCLPYTADSGENFILRFYPENSEYAGTQGETVISLGKDKTARLLCEKTRGRNLPARPSAVALKSVKGKWRQVELNSDQHHIINLAIQSLWETAEEMPEDDPIREDIIKELGVIPAVYPHIPLHIKSAPRTRVRSQIYDISRKEGLGYFPTGRTFRLITHPGTHRMLDGTPRSFNLFIPAEELEVLRSMRQDDPGAYQQWVAHEVQHITDKIAAAAKFEEPTEREVTQQKPLELFIRGYNQRCAREITPDGSPYAIWTFLKEKERPMSVRDIRQLTAGRSTGGHLASETVTRDLATLEYLGLVEKIDGRNPKYRAAISGQRHILRIENELRELGTRPTEEEKRKAKNKIEKMFFQMTDERQGGLFSVRIYKYSGPTRKLPNGEKLVRGRKYAAKVPRKGKTGERQLKTLVFPTAQLYERINPDNSSKYLPKLLGRARDVGMGTLLAPDTPIVEYVPGKTMVDYSEYLKTLDKDTREQYFLEMVIEVLKGYRQVFYERRDRYVHGDLDEKGIIVQKEDSGRPRRIVFVDHDSTTGVEDTGYLARERRRIHKAGHATSERMQRLRVAAESGQDISARPGDDVHAICSALLLCMRLLARKPGSTATAERPESPKPPSESMNSIREVLELYMDTTGRQGDEGTVEKFLGEGITELEKLLQGWGAAGPEAERPMPPEEDEEKSIESAMANLRREGLEDVDAVIADFGGDSILPPDALVARQSLAYRGVQLITVTGKSLDSVIRLCGGREMAALQSMEATDRTTPYIILSHSGAEAHGIVMADGQPEVFEIEGYEERQLGSSKSELATIANDSLLAVFASEGISPQEESRVRLRVTEQQISLITGPSERVNGCRHQIAETIRHQLAEKGYSDNIQVAVSAVAVDIMAADKGMSALQVIKLLENQAGRQLRTVLVIGDSVGTEKAPGNDRGLFTITPGALRESGIDRDIRFIRVYTGSEKAPELPEDVIVATTAPDRDQEVRRRIYDEIIRAKMRAGVTRDRQTEAPGTIPQSKEQYLAWLERKMSRLRVVLDRDNAVRDALRTDASGIIKLSQRIPRANRQKTNSDIESITAGSDSGRRYILVYEPAGDIEGYIWCTRAPAEDLILIEEIVVAEHVQGKGIATLLLAEVIQQGMLTGTEKFRIMVDPEGPETNRLQRMLGSFGFRPGEMRISTLKEYALTVDPHTPRSGSGDPAGQDSSRLPDDSPLSVFNALCSASGALERGELGTQIRGWGLEAESRRERLQESLNTLMYLRVIVEIQDRGTGAKKYLPAYDDREDRRAIRSILAELGLQPGDEDKSEAKTRLETHFFRLREEFEGGVFFVWKVQYRGATRTLRGARPGDQGHRSNRLERGAQYILKVPRESDHDSSLEIVQVLLDPVEDAYRKINPTGKSPYLPQYVCTAGEAGIDAFVDPRTPLVEYVPGQMMGQYIDGLRKESVAVREQRFLEMAMELLRGYAQTYMHNGYLHGDLDYTGILVVPDRRGGVERLVFVDNDSASPMRPRAPLDRRRQYSHKPHFSSKDRMRRLRGEADSPEEAWCLPKDDVYALCTILIGALDDLYGAQDRPGPAAGYGAPSAGMQALREKLEAHRSQVGKRGKQEDAVRLFFEELPKEIQKHRSGSVREIMIPPSTGGNYIAWLRRALLTDGRVEKIDSAHPSDAQRIEDISGSRGHSGLIPRNVTRTISSSRFHRKRIDVLTPEGVVQAYVVYETGRVEGRTVQLTIHGIGVAEEYRGRNARGLLLARTIDKAFTGKKARIFRADVEEGDQGTARFFESQGFKPVRVSGDDGGKTTYLLRLDRHGIKCDPAGLDFVLGVIKSRVRGRDTDVARDFAQRVTNMALRADKEEETVIIGIDTGWIKNMQSELQELITEVVRLSRRKGFENVVVVRDSGRQLVQKLDEAAEEAGVSFRNILVIGEESVLTDSVFEKLRTTAGETKAFFVGIDPGEIEGGYQNFLHIVGSAIALKEGDVAPEEIDGITVSRIGPRCWLFIPDAYPFEPGEIRRRHEAELAFIREA